MSAATFTLTGDLQALVGSATDRSVYVSSSTQVTNPTDDITYERVSRQRSSGGTFTLTLPADAGANLPHDAGGPQFYFTVQVGSKTWIVPAQAASSTHDVTEFDDAIPTPPSSTDTTIVDNIVAGRIAAGGSATRGAGDARWITQTTGDGRYARTTNRPVALKDNSGIDFTGATDSAPALQAAITAAGAGTPIEFGRPGVIRSDSGVTLLSFQQLDGHLPYLGAGGTATGELRFTNIGSTGVGVTGAPGGNNTIRTLLIRGPMTGANSTTGFLTASGAPRLYNVGLYGWATGASLTGAYYSVLDGCEFSGNKTGLLTSGCYNQHLVTPRFNCLYNTSSLGMGIDGAARGMTITAGSIENYGSTGAIKVYSNQVLNLFGTYFESSSSGSGAFGVLAAGIDKTTVNANGCVVMLTEHNRWLHMSTSTNFTVNATGNKFVCPTTSSSTPVAYYLASTDVGNVKGRLGRDDWSEVLKVGATYVPGSLSNLGQVPDLDYRLPGLQYVGGDLAGTGTPEGVVPGPIGAVYRRLDGGATTTLYVKTSGTSTTGWSAK